MRPSKSTTATSIKGDAMSTETNENKEPEWLIKFQRGHQELLELIPEIQYVQDAAEILGMSILAEQMQSLRIGIQVSAKDMNDAVTQMITEQCKNAFQSTNNVLNSALAGVMIGSSKGEGDGKIFNHVRTD